MVDREMELALWLRYTRDTVAAAYRHILLALFLAVMLCPQGAAAEETTRALEAALETHRDGALDRALELFEEALNAPGNEPSDLITIHLYIGMLRGAMGEDQVARRSFEACLALDPSLAEHEEFGPRLQQAFEAVRAERAGRVLSVRVNPATIGDQSGGLDVEIAATNAPEGLVAALELIASVESESPHLTLRVDGAGPTTVTVPPVAHHNTPIRLDVTALDAHGGVLARESRVISPPPTPLADPVESEGAEPGSADGEGRSSDEQHGRREGRRRWYLSAWFWSIIGVVVAGGVTAGVVVGTAQHRYIVGSPFVE